MGVVNLTWRPRVNADEQRLYRGTETFDINSLPASVQVLSGSASSYTDMTAPAGTLYYAIVTVKDGSPETLAMSAVVSVTVDEGGSSGSPTAEIPTNPIAMILTAAPNATTGNVDYTTADLHGFTPKAAILYGSNSDSGADGVELTHSRFFYSVTDGTTHGFHASGKQADSSTRGRDSELSSTGILAREFSNSQLAVLSEATFVSFIENGIRLNWTGTPSETQFMIILFAGDDLNAAVIQDASIATSETTHTVGFAPEVIFSLTSNESLGTNNTSFYNACMSMVTIDGSDYTQVGHTFSGDASNGRSYTGNIMMAQLATTTNGFNWTANITAADATSFGVTGSGTGSTSDGCTFLALGWGGAINYALGYGDMAASTGEQTWPLGGSPTPTWTPTNVIFMNGIENTFGNWSTEKHFGLGYYDANAAGSMTNFSFNGSFDANGAWSNDPIMSLRAETIRSQASVTALNAGEVVVNVSNAPVSARDVPMLAFGIPTAASGGSPAPATPPSARYWRIVFGESVDGDNGFHGIADIDFLDDTGATLGPYTGANAISHAEYSTHINDNAFDGTLTNQWYFDSNNRAGAWIGYDFGSAVAVDAVKIAAPSSALTRGPLSFMVQYSDDNVTWTTDFTVGNATASGAWVASTYKTFDRADYISPSGGISARYWRLNISDNVSDGSFVSIQNLRFTSASGGGFLVQNDATDPIMTSTASSEVSASTAAWEAFEVETGTIWVGLFADLPITIQCDFGEEIPITHVRVQCDSTARAPEDFTIEYSNDGSSWTVAETVAAQAWSSASEIIEYDLTI